MNVFQLKGVSMNTQLRATLSGCAAILLWGCLAYLTDINRQIPPFQLMAMSFATGFAVIALKWKLTGQNAIALFKQPSATWALTLFGLFGYHFFYFLALLPCLKPSGLTGAPTPGPIDAPTPGLIGARAPASG